MTAIEFLFLNIFPFENKTNEQISHIITILKQAKEMEKQQIIDALTYGNKMELMASQKMFAEQYYTSTYGSKGSDETKINLVEIPQEQLEKERNPNYKYFDTSSQTEISDEEIEKAVNEYANVYQCPSELKMCKHDVISAWNNAIKWYREQLKKKQ